MPQSHSRDTKTTPPKVLFFSSSDSGGAGIGARRLHLSLRDHGLGNLMYVGKKQSDAQGVYIPPVPGQKIVELPGGGMALENYLLLERSWLGTVHRQYPNHSKNLEYFTIPGQSVQLDAVPLFADADVISMHWISGFLDPVLSAAQLAGKKLTWTVRDQNPFTGGCHYTGDSLLSG
ncbi:hypothetical protein KL86DPRO_11434 [uncultured delta proteobacterium]|uniref:Uncharacterized protein n=1 Tax=uncultured delta proteobacterium TaxID=34034 RepID=A0A212JH11_9DELT|nr:hypothetical protein KL86DPRO_11434 [uncultured delta proteobacterium]